MTKRKRGYTEDRVASTGLGGILEEDRAAMEARVQVASEVQYLDPREIVFEGYYVREPPDDERERRFRAAIAEQKDVGQPIGVRTAGPAVDKRYILVYGRRRLEAARAAGLPKVLTRNYGGITEKQAILLQMQENQLHREMKPAEIALGCHMLEVQGYSRDEIIVATGHSQSYISEVVRAGEGIAGLSEEEQSALINHPKATIRYFQQLAKLKSAAERTKELKQLLEGKETARSPKARGESAPLSSRAHRNGRSLRLRWTDEVLKKEGAGIVADARRRFAEELVHMADRMNQLVSEGELDADVQGELEELLAPVRAWVEEASKD